VAPVVAHHNGDEMLHCPGENETMLKQFSLFMMSWPQHFLQGCVVILAIDRHTNWYGMVRRPSISMKNVTCMTSTTLTAPCNFLSR
jgi:hypothetical protein